MFADLHRRQRTRGPRLTCGLMYYVACLALSVPAVGTAAATVQIESLSNRADLISGGDALLQITTDTRGMPVVTLNGAPVRDAFRESAPGRYVGYIDGLKLGPNRVEARLGAQVARLVLTNHDSGGPVFSGPQIQPWFCRTVENGFGIAKNDKCAVEPRYEFFYMPAGRDALQPYDPAHPPTDVAMTTTDRGLTVPFVVRRETGSLNRGWYVIAVLFDPGKAWKPGGPPQAAWTGKYTTVFGGGAAVPHHEFDPPGILDPDRWDAGVLNEWVLGRGFLLAMSSLNLTAQNSNEVVSAETAMMLKERIIEQYGPIRYTIATGCSGGSILQLTLANDYPGIVDGIQPNCTFPDGRTGGTSEAPDCELLSHYWDASATMPWSEAQKAAVLGARNLLGCQAWLKSYVSKFDPDNNPCGMNARMPWMYDSKSNPYGRRCTAEDYQENIWGHRDPAQWSAAEILRGTGFARQPWSNEGLEYGRGALEKGVISAEQFVDLNEKIGGKDIDWRFTALRTAGDPAALEMAYRTGRVVDGRGLDRVAILDLRGTENDGIHQDFSSYSLRKRLERANGNADNHVLIRYQPMGRRGILASGAVASDAFEMMDRWLAAIEADRSNDPLPLKVRKNKPRDAVDSCWLDGNTRKTADEKVCDRSYPYFANARMVAGGPLSNDILRCQLRPLDRRDYRTKFTDAQWRLLQAALPNGVCDWSKPGIGQQPAQTWMTFEDGPGFAHPMPEAPASVAIGAQ